MGWINEPMVAFDTETTGPEPATARIVTATVVNIHGAEVSDRTWVLDPGCEIPDEAAAIHGYTTERVRTEGMLAAHGLREIAAAVSAALRDGVPVVAYNASYDFTVLECDLRRNDLPPLEEWIGAPVRPVVDPFVIDRAVDRYRKGKRTLTAACEHYRVRLDGAHDAKQDALSAARVAWRIAQRYDDIGGMTLDELHDFQVEAHRVWAEGFTEYLARKGTPETVDGGWPLRSIEVAA